MTAFLPSLLSLCLLVLCSLTALSAEAAPKKRGSGHSAAHVRHSPTKQVTRVVKHKQPRPLKKVIRRRHGPLAQLPRLQSRVALVVDAVTGQELLAKNASAVLPIASITKLMTAMVVIDSGMPMQQVLTISRGDIDRLKHSRSRLPVGTRLTRAEMLHLALMSSENRAAHALARHHPGGERAFVAAMNAKARQLGMRQTRYADPTGLSPANRSSASDLVRLVHAADAAPLISDLSTTEVHTVSLGRQRLRYLNSNRLVRRDDWDIGLQKTGYIDEAGKCVVMLTSLGGRNVVLVLLDGSGRSRVQDAERIRQWLRPLPGAMLAGVD